jgi:hypothetical protein
MRIGYNGEIEWVFGSSKDQGSPYRIKIEKLSGLDDTMSLMSNNFLSPKGGKNK